jgi:hypothetical protein
MPGILREDKVDPRVKTVEVKEKNEYREGKEGTNNGVSRGQK